MKQFSKEDESIALSLIGTHRLYEMRKGKFGNKFTKKKKKRKKTKKTHRK